LSVIHERVPKYQTSVSVLTLFEFGEPAPENQWRWQRFLSAMRIFCICGSPPLWAMIFRGGLLQKVIP
jgi:hypothetical protein